MTTRARPETSGWVAIAKTPRAELPVVIRAATPVHDFPMIQCRSTTLKLLPCLLLLTGVFSTGVAQDATSQPGATLWNIKFSGSGSTPVIADGVLYVGSADGAVYALDPQTGETKWRFQTGEQLSPTARNRGEGIRRVDMIPAVENGMVFIGSGDHSFYAIDAATGEKKWSFVAGAGMASTNNTPSPVPAPVLKNGTVYFISQEGLHALDVLTGAKKWLFEAFPDISVEDRRSPVGSVQGESAIFLSAWPFLRSYTPRQSLVYAVAPESGTATWVTTIDGIDITAPLAARGFVFVAAEDRGSPPDFGSDQATLYAIREVDGQVGWKLGVQKGSGTSRLLIAGNTIYCSTDKRLVAAELETGRQLWSFSADEIDGAPWADDQHLYLVTHKGSMARPNDTLHALALTSGHEQWSQDFGGRGEIQLIHDGVVYAGGQYLNAINAATGKKLWSFKGSGRESARLIAGGRIFLTSPTVDYFGTSRVDQGRLYAIRAMTGKP